MHQVNTDGIRFGDNFISINEIRKGDSRVLFNEFWFDFLEPFLSGVCVIVNHFIGDAEILHDHSDPFSESSHLPIAQLDWFLHFSKDI